MSHPGAPKPAEDAPVDVRERGATRDGVEQVMDRRLFMQLLAFEGDAQTLAAAMRRHGVASVVYEDVNHPGGVGLLTWSEDPTHFVKSVRPAVKDAGVHPRPELSMLGRTYSTGYESDLEFWLLRRPVETALHEGWDWAVWYPLRRLGAFNRLEGREQGSILREHGQIGRAYGAADLAHDIRLACHGMDTNDNEFVVGLIGPTLHPLSHVVQAMRRTRQTAEFMEKMGPFFVGYAVARTPGR
ncbi:MAG: chlorite dismutase family protein [Polyangiales bacterium]